MNKSDEKKTVWFYVEIAAAVLMIVTLVIGYTTKGLVKNTFSNYIALAAVAGILLQVVYCFVKIEILPLCTSVLYALALGIIGNQGSYVIADHINGVNFLGGNYNMVLQCLGLTCVALVLSILALFNEQTK